MIELETCIEIERWIRIKMDRDEYIDVEIDVEINREIGIEIDITINIEINIDVEVEMKIDTGIPGSAQCPMDEWNAHQIESPGWGE